MRNDAVLARIAPAERNSEQSDHGAPDLAGLEDVLARMGAYIDALDWMLASPPRNTDLSHLLMMEVRADLEAAMEACRRSVAAGGEGDAGAGGA